MKHNLELQALAIREQKIYIQEMPDLTRKPVELFLDIEGIPDQKFYYLMGLLACKGDNCTQHSFWANALEDEEIIWKQLLAKLNEYTEAPIYHYGSYETKAFNDLAKKYTIKINQFEDRLVNINSSIFGKIYFPVHSNSLKEIGAYIDAKWTSCEASGIQSLAWRCRWEKFQCENFKKTLLEYNGEDCHALRLVTNKVSELNEVDVCQECIEFADNVKKLYTQIGKEIHLDLESIIKFSHSNYNKNKISLNAKKEEIASSKPKKRGPKYDHLGHYRITPKPNKSISVPMRTEFPACKSSLKENEKLREKTVIDLRLRKYGLQKVIIKYFGPKGYCEKCCKLYNPIFIDELGNQLFGHAFKAWMVYQTSVSSLTL